MPDHTITVEITVEADSRQIAQGILHAQMERMLMRRKGDQIQAFIDDSERYLRDWAFATHERPDLPALLEAHRYG